MMLEMHDVGLSRDGRVDLDDVTIRVDRGEMVAITGRTGSGKSTLLNIAGGLIKPTDGTVTVKGIPLGEATASELARIRRQHIGWVFQSLNLLPRVTVLDNVALPLELDGVSATSARSMARAALDAVGLGERSNDLPASLSGGERQRVAIARAFVGPRELLLADEPTAALDAVSAEEVMSRIRRECDSGASALVVTHDASQAAWADRVIRLRDGHVVGESAGGVILPEVSV